LCLPLVLGDGLCVKLQCDACCRVTHQLLRSLHA